MSGGCNGDVRQLGGVLRGKGTPSDRIALRKRTLPTFPLSVNRLFLASKIRLETLMETEAKTIERCRERYSSQKARKIDQIFVFTQISKLTLL